MPINVPDKQLTNISPAPPPTKAQKVSRYNLWIKRGGRKIW